MTARQTAFQEAALLAKEEAIAKETQLLFTLQQENHDKEMKAMQEALETMKGDIARLAKQSQKKGGATNNENKIPNTTGTTNPKTANEMTHPTPSVKFGTIPTLLEKQALCPNCKRLGRHRPTDCLELVANKEKCNAMWTTNINN